MNINTLLCRMLYHQELFKKGMCGWISRMEEHNIISPEEREYLLRYIHKNKPPTELIKGFFWEKGEIEPRIDWIKEHLKLN
jgi:hypothetical protein